MSQRDQKLFTKMGKRRAGVTLKKIKDAYGTDYDRLVKAKKKAKPKKKAAAKRKPAAKKKTTKRKPAAKKRKPAKRKTSSKRKTGEIVRVHGLPTRPQKYIIIDGRMRYETSSRLLSTARKRKTALEAKHPRKKFRIVTLEKG